MRGPLLVLVGCVAACGSSPAPDATAPIVSASPTPTKHAPSIVLADGRIAATAVVHVERSACALLVDGSVWCWDVFYQRARSSLAAQPIPLPKVASIVAAGGLTLALTEQGDVYAWGAHPSLGDVITPLRLEVAGVRRVTGGADYACFLLERGEARCDDLRQGVRSALPSVGDAPIVAVSARAGDVCVATEARVVCHGPDAIEEHRVADVVDLATSLQRTCARTRTGRVTCWSGVDVGGDDPFAGRTFVALESNDAGVCARPLRGPPTCWTEVSPTDQPPEYAAFDVAMRAHREATSVSLARSGACFTEAGYVWCWGDADAIGYAAEPTRLDLGDLASVASAAGVAVGREHTCILGTDAVVRCWGGNVAGALGVGDANPRLGPERWRGVPPIARIAASEFMTCAVTRDPPSQPSAQARGDEEEGGRVLCAGAFHTGLGAPNCFPGAGLPCTSTPTLVTTGAQDVSIGVDYACVLDRTGGVRCWGDNELGQLGAGDDVPSDTPRQVVDASGAPLARVVKVSASRSHACAILEDGSLSCWGYDDPGVQGRAVEPGLAKPGRGAVRVAATPVPMPGRVLDVSDGCAVLEGGETRCWGPLPTGDFAVSPTRVGVCGATATKAGCFLGATRVTCAADPPPEQPTAPYAGPPIVAWAINDVASCVVDVDHRAACRWRWEGTSFLGAGGPGLYAVDPTPACPEAPPTGARAPVALWYRSYAQAPSGRTQNLTADDVKILAETMDATPVKACSGAPQELYFFFEDAQSRPVVRLRYVGAPCEGLLDLHESDQPIRKLGPAGRKLVKSILKTLGDRPGVPTPE